MEDQAKGQTVNVGASTASADSLQWASSSIKADA